ncbi:hypothetical protein GZL_01685 [Streptomyces sp. 769]|nr:hypothetical protein GZL_01685 [Streptomyces sp. 769]
MLADSIAPEHERRLTPGVRWVGTASFPADVGHVTAQRPSAPATCRADNIK